MKPLVYRLEGRIPVPAEVESMTNADWRNRDVAKTRLFGGILVSTVFLNIDHSFGGGRPVLFETMIFNGIHDQYQRRYCTFTEAEVGHREAVKMARRTAWLFWCEPLVRFVNELGWTWWRVRMEALRWVNKQVKRWRRA